MTSYGRGMLVRAQTIIPFRTNLPKDVISNTMWFNTAPGIDLGEAAEAIQPNLFAAYMAAYAAISGTAAMATYINEVTPYTNFYNQDAPEPRIPYRVEWATLTNSQGATPIPTEVACVLSYRAALENGVNPARRRGRIYLGGLGPATISNSSGTAPFFPIFNPTFVTNVINGFKNNLLTPTDWGGDFPSSDITWSVHSTIDGFHAPVVAGWVDNTPDTQRRRGVLANVRTAW